LGRLPAGLHARQVTKLSAQFGESEQGNPVVAGFNSNDTGGETVTLSTESAVLLDYEG
jgi:hypothetical protein